MKQVRRIKSMMRMMMKVNVKRDRTRRVSLNASLAKSKQERLFSFAQCASAAAVVLID